jgi:hypothetical protein
VYEDVERAYERAGQSTRQQAVLPLLDTVLATFRQLVATSQQSAELESQDLHLLAVPLQ